MDLGGLGAVPAPRRPDHRSRPGAWLWRRDPSSSADQEVLVLDPEVVGLVDSHSTTRVNFGADQPPTVDFPGTGPLPGRT